MAFGDFVSDLKLIFSGDLKKAIHTKNVPKHPNTGADVSENMDEESGKRQENADISKIQHEDEHRLSFDDKKAEEDSADTDADQPLDLEQQLVTSICHGLSSDDPEIRDAASRVVQSMQVMKTDDNDDNREALLYANASDVEAQDGYGSTSNNSLRSREYETFNPLHSFPGVSSNASSLNKDKAHDDQLETEQTDTSSFLLNPLHTFVNDNKEEDSPSSETTSLLPKRTADTEYKNTSNVALRPSIFTKHD